MNFLKIALFIFLLSLIGCATVSESEKDNSTETQSVYVFDDVSSDSTTAEVSETNEATPEPEEKTNSTFEFFIVQLGAFSTLDKAQTFVNNTKSYTEYDLNIHFSEKVNLHVFQLPPFRTRTKAEEVRDKLKTIPEFNGAFIVPNNK
jgi:cell division septation protein DedD